MIELSYIITQSTFWNKVYYLRCSIHSSLSFRADFVPVSHFSLFFFCIAAERALDANFSASYFSGSFSFNQSLRFLLAMAALDFGCSDMMNSVRIIENINYNCSKLNQSKNENRNPNKIKLNNQSIIDVQCFSRVILALKLLFQMARK